jgi:hypothetical protein
MSKQSQVHQSLQTSVNPLTSMHLHLFMCLHTHVHYVTYILLLLGHPSCSAAFWLLNKSHLRQYILWLFLWLQNKERMC